MFELGNFFNQFSHFFCIIFRTWTYCSCRRYVCQAICNNNNNNNDNNNNNNNNNNKT